MKIYTKRGDKGNTSLFGGTRVSKSSARLQAYGTVDELNSVIGMAASHELSSRGTAFAEKIQTDLFILGADLATPFTYKKRIDRIDEDVIQFLENSIDEMEEELPPLKNFILPGGAPGGAALHLARTVCRRAERAAVQCAKEEKISELAIKYLNRLSDFLFVWARYENRQAGDFEVLWKPEKKQ